MTEEKNELQNSQKSDSEITEADNSENLSEDLSEDSSEDLSDDSSEDSSEELTDEYLKALKEKNKQLFERAKKAEAELKKIKLKPKQNAETPQYLTREEAILLKGDLEIEDVDYLKVIQAGLKSQGDNKSLSELKNHPLFIAYLKDKQEKIKSEKAKLNASSKSFIPSAKKEMTREEHVEFWKRSMGQL